MASLLAWLDQDERQRHRMDAVMELFKDGGTIDELGVGSVRDAVADILFPGGSVLHTRARYLLFVPWLAREAATGRAPEVASKEFRGLEIRLIYSLLAGGERSGVIGSQSKDSLKRMPSAAYWAALKRYGIAGWNTTIDGFFRHYAAQQRRRDSQVLADDPGATTDDASLPFHPDLPPMPNDLLEETTFALTGDEGRFLAERIDMTCRGSLLAWLLGQDTVEADEIWRHPLVGSFPTDMRNLVEHGRRFATVIHGAPILYNLMLAEAVEEEGPIERYREMFATWQDEMDAERPLQDWNIKSFWDFLSAQGRPVSFQTRVFVERWVEVMASAIDPDSAAARGAIRDREVSIKGGRARLVNRSTLDSWKGDSGLVRLDFRWHVARRVLLDIAESRPAERVV